MPAIRANLVESPRRRPSSLALGLKATRPTLGSKEGSSKNFQTGSPDLEALNKTDPDFLRRVERQSVLAVLVTMKCRVSAIVDLPLR